MKDRYDIYFNEEHLVLRDAMQSFVKKEFPPDYVNKMERQKEFPFEVRDKLRELGLYWGIPDEYGGMPIDYRSTVIAYEELAKASASICRVLMYMGGASTVSGFLKRCNEDIQKELFPKLVNGELIWGLAMTESGGGTDLLNNIKTTAREDGDDFVINGEKMFITIADIADHMFVLCKTGKEDDPPFDKFSLILLDMKMPGIDVTKLDKMCIQSISSNIVSFNDVRVPKKNLVGDKGRGYAYCLSYVAGSKLFNAAESLGNAEAAYAEANEHAKLRQSFGHPIGRFQLIQDKIVDMEIGIRTVKHQCYHTAYLADNNREWLLDAMIAEKYSSDVGVRTTTKAMEIFGGYGLMKDYNLERYFRDSRLFITAGYSAEMKTMQIAKLLGHPHYYANPDSIQENL